MIIDPHLSIYKYPLYCKAYVENGRIRRRSPLLLGGHQADGDWVYGTACGMYQSRVIFHGDNGETYIIEHSAQLLIEHKGDCNA